MGKLHDKIDGRLRDFIERQHVFFVATAPLAGDGHVNLSPRGIAGTSVVADGRTFAWLDGSGSGSETIAHLRENGRITVMFCAFEGPPNIVRLHGTGRVVSIYDEEYADWSQCFVDLPGARAVIVVDVERISDSCGYGVPMMTHAGERDLYQRSFGRRGPQGSADYRRRNNRTSLDGLPAYDFDPTDDWASPEGLGRVRERYAAQIDGWRAPAAFAVALDGDFPHVNGPGGRHGLAAVMLARALGHDGGTATLPVTPDQLAEAVRLLEPAEACTGLDHPNLAAWRRVLAEAEGRPVHAVFVGSVEDEVSSEIDALLRARL